MNESMKACLQIYFNATVFFVVWHVFLPIWFRGRINKNHYISFLTTFWSFYLFNIAYTGYFGWNLDAASKTEQLLDNISTAGLLVSMIMMFRSIKTSKSIKISNKKRK